MVFNYKIKFLITNLKLTLKGIISLELSLKNILAQKFFQFYYEFIGYVENWTIILF